MKFTARMLLTTVPLGAVLLSATGALATGPAALTPHSVTACVRTTSVNGVKGSVRIISVAPVEISWTSGAPAACKSTEQQITWTGGPGPTGATVSIGSDLCTGRHGSSGRDWCAG